MILPADFKDAKTISEVALKSKAYWGYTNEQLESWIDELTITSEYISKNSSYVYKLNENIVGFYIIEMLNMTTISLEFLFVLPEFIGKGIGHQLISHAIEKARNLKGFVLNTLSDPNAESFYAKYGFKTISHHESSIPDRFLPEMELEFPENM